MKEISPNRFDPIFISKLPMTGPESDLVEGLTGIEAEFAQNTSMIDDCIARNARNMGKLWDSQPDRTRQKAEETDVAFNAAYLEELRSTEAKDLPDHVARVVQALHQLRGQVLEAKVIVDEAEPGGAETALTEEKIECMIVAPDIGFSLFDPEKPFADVVVLPSPERMRNWREGAFIPALALDLLSLSGISISETSTKPISPEAT